MTQIFSSFKKSWLGDFLLRCFAKSYPVECSNKPDSPVKHDFRRCPKCQEFVDQITQISKGPMCSSCCKGLLHLSSGLINEDFYRDSKGREFRLEKPLYSWFFSWAILLGFVFWGVFLSLFKFHSFVPDNFLFQTLIFLLFPVTFSLVVVMVSFNLKIKSLYREKIRKIFLFSLVLSMVFAMSAVLIFDRPRWTFRWENPPTQAEWMQQQNELAVEEFRKLEGLKQLDFGLTKQKEFPGSKDWHDLVTVSFTKVLYQDFAGAMARYQKHYIFAHNFDIYTNYEKYLEVLAENRRYDLYQQCSHDPWNLATGEAFEKYLKIFDICKTVTEDDRKEPFQGF